MTNEIEQLIDRARSGERLTSTDRQKCVAFLIGIGKLSNVALGKLFHVSEGQIRNDRKRLLPKPKPNVVVTLTPANQPPVTPAGYELVRVTEYLLVVPYDQKEIKRLMRDDGCKKQKVRASSVLRMSLAAIAADIAKGKL